MRYSVRLQLGDLSVELTEESTPSKDSLPTFVDRAALEERALKGLDSLIQTFGWERKPTPSAWVSPRKVQLPPVVELACDCGIKVDDVVAHERTCTYRLGMAIVEGHADRI